MKNPWVIIGVIVIVLFGGAIWYSGTAAEQNNEGVELLPHIKGNSDAAVTLVEYSDFECPACASFQPVVKQLLDEYGDSIRFEYRHFPLPIPGHENARAAAAAAEAAAQQDKFFEFHDILFERQREWGSAAVPRTYFLQYAEELGLDVDMFKRHLSSSLIEDKVAQSLNEARELQLTGTPTFFLNNQKMDFTSYEEFFGQILYAIDPTSASSTEPTSNVIFGL